MRPSGTFPALLCSLGRKKPAGCLEQKCWAPRCGRSKAWKGYASAQLPFSTSWPAGLAFFQYFGSSCSLNCLLRFEGLLGCRAKCFKTLRKSTATSVQRLPCRRHAGPPERRGAQTPAWLAGRWGVSGPCPPPSPPVGKTPKFYLNLNSIVNRPKSQVAMLGGSLDLGSG